VAILSPNKKAYYVFPDLLTDAEEWLTVVLESASALLVTPVPHATNIFRGYFDGFTWIRSEGKGNFMNSPSLKKCAESVINNGERHVVIDLEECHAMDSTFMGTLAGIAIRLKTFKNGCLQLASVSERNRQSLEDLGLSMMMSINPADAEWVGAVSEIREKLESSEEAGDCDRTEHVYEAHKTLCDADENNVEKFKTVLNVFEAQRQAEKSPIK